MLHLKESEIRELRTGKEMKITSTPTSPSSQDRMARTKFTFLSENKTPKMDKIYKTL